jgi:hypothetical protein
MAKKLLQKLLIFIIIVIYLIINNRVLSANTFSSDRYFTKPSPLSFNSVFNNVNNKKFNIVRKKQNSKKPYDLINKRESNYIYNYKILRAASSLQLKILKASSFLEKLISQNKAQNLKEKIYQEGFLNLDFAEYAFVSPTMKLESCAAKLPDFTSSQTFQNCIQPLEFPAFQTHRLIENITFEECFPNELSAIKTDDTLETKFFRKEYIAISSYASEESPKLQKNLRNIPNFTFKILDNLKEVSIFIGAKGNKFVFKAKLAEFFSKNFGITLTEEDDPRLYEFAAKWLYTPYVWGGQSKRGVDCSGLAVIFADSIYKIKVPRVAGDILSVCQPIKKQDLQQGDFVFFNRGNYTFHMGIYLKNSKFLHACLAGGVVVDDINSPYYRRYYYCGGRIANYLFARR